MSRVLFITGTDTGVGKTVLTSLLLRHLRQTGVRALAMKPFCSGGTGDVEILEAVQGAAVPRALINPFYFHEPLAPLVAARRRRRRIELGTALGAIQRLQRACDVLLVEGSGGLLAPLGEGFSLAELVVKTRGQALVVAPNRLGTISHTRLTIEALQRRGVRALGVVLMQQSRADASARSNPRLLGELLHPISVMTFPYLGLGKGRGKGSGVAFGKTSQRTKKVLARIVGPDTFCPRCSTRS